MTPELNSLARSGVVILSTYLLHSFVVLGATWLVLVASRTNSWTLRERVWRWMAVLPFVTASVQLAWVDHSPLVAWTFAESSSVAAYGAWCSLFPRSQGSRPSLILYRTSWAKTTLYPAVRGPGPNFRDEPIVFQSSRKFHSSHD